MSKRGKINAKKGGDGILDESTFNAQLYSFMYKRGTQILKIPTFDHKELNLYRLYCEVVSRGGLKQAILDKQWRQITLSMGAPVDRTDAGFRLRQHYERLLYPYERVFFFHKKDVSNEEAISQLSLKLREASINDSRSRSRSRDSGSSRNSLTVPRLRKSASSSEERLLRPGRKGGHRISKGAHKLSASSSQSSGILTSRKSPARAMIGHSPGKLSTRSSSSEITRGSEPILGRAQLTTERVKKRFNRVSSKRGIDSSSYYSSSDSENGVGAMSDGELGANRRTGRIRSAPNFDLLDSDALDRYCVAYNIPVSTGECRDDIVLKVQHHFDHTEIISEQQTLSNFMNHLRVDSHYSPLPSAVSGEVVGTESYDGMQNQIVDSPMGNFSLEPSAQAHSLSSNKARWNAQIQGIFGSTMKPVFASSPNIHVNRDDGVFVMPAVTSTSVPTFKQFHYVPLSPGLPNVAGHSSGGETCFPSFQELEVKRSAVPQAMAKSQSFGSDLKRRQTAPEIRIDTVTQSNTELNS